MAASFISMTGIIREELPLDKCSSGVYIIYIPGLCAGSSFEPSHDTLGYITFVRYEKST